MVIYLARAATYRNIQSMGLFSIKLMWSTEFSAPTNLPAELETLPIANVLLPAGVPSAVIALSLELK
jgi:hypothetical protein